MIRDRLFSASKAIDGDYLTARDKVAGSFFSVSFVPLWCIRGRRVLPQFLTFSLLAAASGALFTSIGCLRARIHNRRPGWHLILLGTVVTVLIAMLYVGQADLFRPQRWDEYKGGTSGFWRPIVFVSKAAAGIAAMSSLAVVLYFRGSFGDVEPVA